MAPMSTVSRLRAARDLARRMAMRVRYGRSSSPRWTLLSSYEDYLRYSEANRGAAETRYKVELSLLGTADSFTINGLCYPCRKPCKFSVDYRYGCDVDGIRIPNWRETLVCECGLSNRLRASIQIFERFCKPKRSDRIYITEQTTPMYRWLADRYARLTGSEYLADRIPFGTVSGDGVRNESLTRLTFPDAHFDHIISFDVLEHIPEVDRALRECQRCLKPGGSLLLSVPFVPTYANTLVRARLGENGALEHLLPPEYHGDPLSTDGCLCFYHFGWDLMEQMRNAGFSRAQVVMYWSQKLGYLGVDQFQILATK